MSIDLSKIGYGVIVDPVAKGGGVALSKVTYGIIIDTLNEPPAPRQRRRRLFLP